MSDFFDDIANENRRLNSEAAPNFLDNFVRMPENNGNVNMRILPPAVSGMFGREKNPFYVVTRVHRINDRSVHCPRELDKSDNYWKGECPICWQYSKLWKESEKADAAEAEALQNEARAIKPVERYYYNVIVREQTNPSTNKIEYNVGPKILSVGRKLHKFIISKMVGDKELKIPGLGNVAHITEGYDFKLVKQMTKSGNNTYPNYDLSFFDKEQSPLGNPDEVEQWLANLHDLNTLRIIRPMDELERELEIYLGLVADEATGFDAKFGSKAKPATAAATVSVAVPEYQAQKVAPKSVEPAPTVHHDSVEELADADFLKAINNL